MNNNKNDNNNKQKWLDRGGTLEHIGTKRKKQPKNTTQRNKPEGTGERKKTKKISRQDEIIQTKQKIPKQRKKILSVNRGRMHKHIPTIGWQRNKTILEQNITTRRT